MSRGNSALANAIRQQALMAMNQFSQPRHAIISSYDPNRHAVKVTLYPENVISNWMPLGAIGIGNGWGVAVAPALGDQVLVIYEGGDFSSGTIVARIFSIAQQAPVIPSGEIWMIHKSGSYLKFTNDTAVTLNAPGGLTINAETTMNGSMAVNGNVLVNTGASGTFTSGDGQTITVQDGIVTNIF